MKLFAVCFIAVLLVTTLLGCQRPVPNTAALRIQIPSVRELQAIAAKTGAPGKQSAIDYARLCFGVNITGSGITSTTRSCDIERGVFQGSKPPGSELSVEVPQGNDRSVEVYGFLRSSTNVPCPEISAEGWNWPVQRIYFLGATKGIPMNAAEVPVRVEIQFPDRDANLYVAHAWPVTCAALGGLPGGLTGTIAQMRAANSQVNGASFGLFSRADVLSGKTVSGTHFRLQGRIKDK